MNVSSIIQDVTENFRKDGITTPFWEDDTVLTGTFEGLFTEHPIESSAVVYSFSSSVIHDTEKYFKKMGKAPERLWKPVLCNVAKKLFEEMDADYNATVVNLRKKYQVPMSPILTEADDILKQLRDLVPIRSVMTDSDGLECVRGYASGYVDGILQLFKNLDTADTPYASGTELIEAYSQIVEESFNILISLSDDGNISTVDGKGDEE